jgi:malate dehydrogenase (oxaloacetate-decarboxylating)
MEALSMPHKQALADTIGAEIHAMPLTGNFLVECSLTNKGTAFTQDERRDFGLEGLLPPHILSIEEQAGRVYGAYSRQITDIDKHIYLRGLQDRNETLFYKLLIDHLTEMLPIIYTPIVGEACQRFSEIYRKPRGLFIAYPDRERIGQILDNAATPRAEVIVVTDGERILGLGDQGAGGMGIPIGKLALYTAAAGIHPATTLPIFLDVGTNNEECLNDPVYIGWRHERIEGPEYDDFVDAFVQAVKQKFPSVLLQWEDFAQHHAGLLLHRYRDQICSFNDDIQGTAAVTLSTLLAAAHASGTRLRDHTVCIFGAGSAGCGIAEQLIAAMVQEGLAESEARARFFMIDRPGLLHDGLNNLPAFQQGLVQPRERLANWPTSGERITLEDVVRNAKPTVLIGVSGQPGVFTEEAVRGMAGYAERPIIFPLSNPTSRVEATPADLLAWTDGRALVASGSPFEDVSYGGTTFSIAQNNNSYIFPGIGLGALAVKANRISDEMIMAAARALSECAPVLGDPKGSLLPDLQDLRQVSRRIGLAVAREAYKQGFAHPTVAEEEIERLLDEKQWEPRYLPMRRKNYEHLARHDELTGLYNNRVLRELTALETTRAKRYGSALSVLILEVGNFMEVHNTHGEETANELLIQTARVIDEMIRDTDVAARHGRSMFSILLPGTKIDGAQMFMSRILSTIAELKLDGANGQKIPISCAVGISEFDPETDDAARLLERADLALHKN